MTHFAIFGGLKFLSVPFFLQDYPSVGQINAKLRENDIIPIFAVAQSSTTQNSIDIYRVIHYTVAADPCMHKIIAKMNGFIDVSPKVPKFSYLLSIVNKLIFRALLNVVKAHCYMCECFDKLT